MPKSLGMIHTINQTMKPTRQGDIFTVDLSSLLSRQLQHMVRQGNYFKTVGIDMAMTGFDTGDNDTVDGGQISGRIRYFAPTRGRCNAYRNAFQVVMDGMKDQGLSLKGNKLYDFKVALSNPGNSQILNGTEAIANLATVNGSDPLTLIDSGTSDNEEVFSVYNSNVMPFDQTAAALNGRLTFNKYGSTTDFVLDETANGYFGNDNLANVQWEEIPFQLGFDELSDSVSPTFQFRPDPALYIAVMAGLFEIHFDAVSKDGDADELHVNLAIHVSGWKSIMGNPDKKKSMPRKRSSRGRRRSKK